MDNKQTFALQTGHVHDVGVQGNVIDERMKVIFFVVVLLCRAVLCYFLTVLCCFVPLSCDVLSLFCVALFCVALSLFCVALLLSQSTEKRVFFMTEIKLHENMERSHPTCIMFEAPNCKLSLRT